MQKPLRSRLAEAQTRHKRETAAAAKHYNIDRRNEDDKWLWVFMLGKIKSLSV